MILSGCLTHWNLYGEVVLTFLLAAASAVMVYRLGCQTLAGRMKARAGNRRFGDPVFLPSGWRKSFAGKTCRRACKSSRLGPMIQIRGS